MTYVCQYCGKVLYSTEQYVEVCQCEDAQREEQSLKERNKQIFRQKQQTFEDARRNNKRPIRK